MNAYMQLFEEKQHPLIMSIPCNDADIAEAAFNAGADAVKVHVNLTHHASKFHFGAASEHRECFERLFACRRGPLGVVLGDSAQIVRDTFADTLAYPFDFVSLYAAHTPTEILRLPQARMIACDGNTTLKEVEEFAGMGANILEASMLPPEEYGKPLQMMDLIRYRQLVEASGLPVVVPTQRAIRPEDVKALFDVGVRGLMIGAIVTGVTRDSVKRAVEIYRNAIDRL